MELKVFYDGVDAILLSPIYVVREHELYIVQFKFSRPAEPKTVVVVVKFYLRYFRVDNPLLELCEDLLLHGTAVTDCARLFWLYRLLRHEP